MPITIRLPLDVEQRLREQTDNLDLEMTEALAVEMFRRGRLTHYELSQVLGLNRFETDHYLQQHHIYDGAPTSGEIEADRESLKSALAEKALNDDRRR